MSVTTNAVSRLNATEVGRSRPPTIGGRLPLRSTRTSVPVFGDAGAPASAGSGQLPDSLGEGIEPVTGPT
ncbi:MAG: hypothetical protein ACXVH1_23140 [Solirubrobacteraceae bacterium]